MCRCGWCGTTREEPREEFDSRGPEGTDAPLVALAVQPDTPLRAQLQVLDPEIGKLLDPRASVVEQQEQGSVAQGEAPRGREIAKECLDLLAFEESGFWRGDAFDRYCRYLLGNGQ